MSILIAALFCAHTVPSLIRSVYGNNQLAIDRSTDIFSEIIKILINNVPESMPALVIILCVALLRTLHGSEMKYHLLWEVSLIHILYLQ